jgi:hypothetical protein
MGNVPCVSCAVVQRPTAPAPCRLDPTALDPAIATPVVGPSCAHGIWKERHGPTGRFSSALGALPIPVVRVGSPAPSLSASCPWQRSPVLGAAANIKL